MTIRLLVAIILALVVQPVAAAQEYYIEVGYNTNLRVAPGLHSAVHELVLAGSILVVEGEAGDWLQIDRFGDTAWMANWVAYQRVGVAKQIETRFADLKCRSGMKWTQDESYPWGGYWSSRSDRCRLVTRSPLSLFPNEVFAGNDGEIAIEGPQEIANQINQALELLQERAPKWHAFVNNAARKIIGYEEGSRYDISVNAYVKSNLKTIFVSEHAAFTWLGVDELAVIGLASVLIHESCHLHQVGYGIEAVGPGYEIMCHVLEKEAHKDIGAPLRLGHTVDAMLKYYLEEV